MVEILMLYLTVLSCWCFLIFALLGRTRLLEIDLPQFRLLDSVRGRLLDIGVCLALQLIRHWVSFQWFWGDDGLDGCSTSVAESISCLKVQHHRIGARLAVYFGHLVGLQLLQNVWLTLILRLQWIQCPIGLLSTLEIVLTRSTASVLLVAFVSEHAKFLRRHEVLIRWWCIAIISAVPAGDLLDSHSAEAWILLLICIIDCAQIVIIAEQKSLSIRLIESTNWIPTHHWDLPLVALLLPHSMCTNTMLEIIAHFTDFQFLAHVWSICQKLWALGIHLLRNVPIVVLTWLCSAVKTARIWARARGRWRMISRAYSCIPIATLTAWIVWIIRKRFVITPNFFIQSLAHIEVKTIGIVWNAIMVLI